MDDAVLVSLLQTFRYLFRDGDGLLDRDRAPLQPLR